jgi:hypothetical protein
MTRRTRRARSSNSQARRGKGPGIASDLTVVAVLSAAAWWLLADLAEAPGGITGYVAGLVAGLSVAVLTPRWTTRAARRLGWRVSFTERARW